VQIWSQKLSDSPQLVLYTGSLCHLCNQAREVLYGALPDTLRFTEITIDEDLALKNTYGFRIPVFAVRNSNGAVLLEKDWPFTAGQVKKIISDYCEN